MYSGRGTTLEKDVKVVVSVVVLGHVRNIDTSLGDRTGIGGGRGLWGKYI